MTRTLLQAVLGLILLFTLLLTGCRPSHSNRIVVGSKNFTEQVVLAELLAQHIEARLHVPVDRRFYLAGSYIAHQSLISGRIDLYPEYTGTALTAILKKPAQSDSSAVYNLVKDEYAKRFHLTVTEPLGFNNTFAMVMRGDEARKLHLTTLSQASQYSPQWHLGCAYEFSERPDGLQGLIKTYNLQFAGPPRIMDLGLLYRALQEKQVDLIAANATDGLIASLGLTILQDDRHYFPPYEAVPIVRDDTLQRFPGLQAALSELHNQISDAEMRELNYAVDGRHRDVPEVVAEFRKRKGL
ncbi:MAG TPA: glycine betaine ABC transporter substrate-binding protein [Terriglobales bacterium]